MTDVRQLGRQVMAAKLVTDLVKRHGDQWRQQLQDALTAGGVETLRVKDDAGANLGTVSITGNRQRKARVVDEAAFLDWVERTRPDEVVHQVRPATRKKLLDAATAAGDDVPVDTTTGEVIPGVEMADGDPHVTVRPTAFAREQMAAALSGDELVRRAIGAGESGEDDDSDAAP